MKIEFHFDRIPKELHAQVIEYVRMENLNALLKIHNKYKLSQYDYSCCGLYGMLDWFKYGIAHGQISVDKQMDA